MLGFALLEVAVFWSVVAGLFWLARRLWRRRRILRFVPLVLGTWFVVGAIVPVVGTPLLIPAVATAGIFNVTATTYVLSTLRSHLENRRLLHATDLRRATISFGFTIDGEERTGEVSVRCAERRITGYDFFDVMVRHLPLAVAGELDIALAEGVSAHAVPPNWLCGALDTLPTGEQAADLVRPDGGSMGTWNIVVIDRTRPGARPLVLTFNTADGPVTIGAVTVLRPIVRKVQDDGRITPAEFARYAPPYETARDRGPERPAILDDFRPAFQIGTQPVADYLTESSWCTAANRDRTYAACLPSTMVVEEVR